MNRPGLRVLVAVALAGVLAACSNSSATTTSLSTTANTPSSPATAAQSVPASSAPPRPSPTTSPAPSSSTPAAPTTANPWPESLTPEQQAMAQAALTAYQQAWKTTDEAYGDPTQSWEPTIRQYIADPYALVVLKSLQGLANKQFHTVGSNKVDAVVTAVEGSGDGAMVTIDACVDSSGGDLLNASGVSVKAPLPVGPRIKQSANVYKYADKDGGWLLSEVNVPDPYEPC